MKVFGFVIFLALANVATQQDSIDVFFIGDDPGERYKVFWDGKLMLSSRRSIL
jgi:hypothetical protein